MSNAEEQVVHSWAAQRTNRRRHTCTPNWRRQGARMPHFRYRTITSRGGMTASEGNGGMEAEDCRGRIDCFRGECLDSQIADYGGYTTFTTKEADIRAERCREQMRRRLVHQKERRSPLHSTVSIMKIYQRARYFVQSRKLGKSNPAEDSKETDSGRCQLYTLP